MTTRWLIATGAVGLLMAQPAIAQDAPSEEQGQGEEMQCRAGGEILEFRTGSAKLDNAARASLEGAKSWLAEQEEERRLRLEGFSSPSGPAAFNKRLSEQRAESARQYLIAQGASPDRIVAVGRGEQPSMPGGGPGRQAVVVLYCDGEETMAAAEPEVRDEEALAEEPIEEQPQEPEMAAEPAEEPAADEEVMAEEETTPYTPPTEEIAAAPQEESMVQRLGLGVSIGGGVVGFVDEEARDLTDIGGSWEARFTFGTQLPVGLEAAYIGSAQAIEAAGLGLNDDIVLMGNGAEVALRVQLPTFFVQPYALAGLGWTYYSLVNEEGDAGPLDGDDNVLTTPLGVGVALRAPFGATFDVRGIYKFAFGADMLNGVYEGTGDSAAFDTWLVNARLGWTF